MKATGPTTLLQLLDFGFTTATAKSTNGFKLAHRHHRRARQARTYTQTVSGGALIIEGARNGWAGKGWARQRQRQRARARARSQWLWQRWLIEHLTHQIERERFNGYALTVAINLRHSY